MTAAVPGPRFRDQLAEAPTWRTELWNRLSDLLGQHGPTIDSIDDDEHDDLLTAFIDGLERDVLPKVCPTLPIAAEVEARVQAAANQREAETWHAAAVACDRIGVPAQAAAFHAARAAALASPAPEAPPCWCITCEHLAVRARTEAGDPLAMFARRFIVCPDCGNKRCPKATHHNLACTGSNEPGQPGSAYAQIVSPPTSVEELRARIAQTLPAPAPRAEEGQR